MVHCWVACCVAAGEGPCVCSPSVTTDREEGADHSSRSSSPSKRPLFGAVGASIVGHIRQWLGMP